MAKKRRVQFDGMLSGLARKSSTEADRIMANAEAVRFISSKATTCFPSNLKVDECLIHPGCACPVKAPPPDDGTVAFDVAVAGY
eukprot:7505753-Alexandrium_andersonii.AAC.1